MAFYAVSGWQQFLFISIGDRDFGNNSKAKLPDMHEKYPLSC
jgi:hypothetical protein